MKNKIALATAALVAGSSFSTAEIVINDFLSFEGFVDMSYSHTDSELDSSSESNNNFDVDQVEIVWLFDFDPVTAQIDLNYEDDSKSSYGSSDVVEQAFATYHMEGGSAITAGRYDSMLGFEAFEPTGLYQYSFAYDVHDAPGSIGNIGILPLQAQGVKYTFSDDTSFFGISLQDEAFEYDNDRLGGSGNSSYAIEIAGSVRMDSGVGFFLGGVYEDGEDGSLEGDTYAINTYVTLETGAWIFAGELIYGESETNSFALGSNSTSFSTASDEEVLQALLMANFAYSDNASVTGRISYADHELTQTGSAGSTSEVEADFVKFTLAHGYAFTDNLILVNEFSFVDGEIGSADYESLLFASELIFSF